MKTKTQHKPAPFGSHPDDIAELQHINTELLKENEGLKALNAELLQSLKVTLSDIEGLLTETVENSPENLQATIITIQKAIAKASGQ